jgi:hypothetical protein
MSDKGMMDKGMKEKTMMNEDMMKNMQNCMEKMKEMNCGCMEKMKNNECTCKNTMQDHDNYYSKNLHSGKWIMHNKMKMIPSDGMIISCVFVITVTIGLVWGIMISMIMVMCQWIKMHNKAKK